MPKVSGVNKSALIRDYFRDHPSSRISDCMEFMKGLGHEVSYGLVATVKSRAPKEAVVSDEDVVRVRDYIRVSNLDEEVALRILSDFARLVQVVGGLDRFRGILASLSSDSSSSDPDESSYSDPNEDED